jgi:hypothetical protein
MTIILDLQTFSWFARSKAKVVGETTQCAEGELFGATTWEEQNEFVKNSTYHCGSQRGIRICSNGKLGCACPIA